MEASTSAASSSLPTPQKFEPDIEAIKRRLLKYGVYPTPKIIHNIRKKEIQKHNRKLNKIAEKAEQQQTPPLTPSQKQALAAESNFQKLRAEYRDFTKAIKAKTRTESNSSNSGGLLLVGWPWERIERVKLREIASESKEIFGGKLERENLRELKQVFEDGLKWVLDNDIEMQDYDWINNENNPYDPEKVRRRRSDREAIGFLVHKLGRRDVTVRDWKLARIMIQSGLRFSEGQLLKILNGLGEKGKWEQAMAVVEWVYNDKERRDCKSRFVYTKLLSVLGNERRPQEALHIFNLMREDRNTYPDMAAYHTIAVMLGQAGLLKELMKIIECMRQKPKRFGNMRLKYWDPVLEPDLVIYNAVMNACIPSRQWKGAYWVFQQLRKSGLKPNAATYGLAMEVMLHSGKHDLVHKLFGKMNGRGEAPKALTYKVLVRALWEEGKVNEAVKAIRDMEQRGVVATASVYYELACCLCNNGRLQDAMLEVEKIKRRCHSKPLEFTFTGMILSSLEGGHVDDCISIFKHMKAHCVPNIGTVNIMLKVYGKNDLFSEAKELFEEIKGANVSDTSLVPDEFTYSSMLEACARALQWEYFEYVYREMAFCGYQLDQSKHASLLVKASRAGKGHLLEHAFNAMLRVGEIPHPLLFTEMVIQAVTQQNYERAVILVKTMAYAPFRISERQWTYLFEKNRDRIGQNSLERLLDALANCDIVSEDTVLNFARSLHSLCGSDRSGDSLSSIASSIEDIDNLCLDTNTWEISGKRRMNMPSSVSMMDGCSELDEVPLVSKGIVMDDILTVNHCGVDGAGDDGMDVVSSQQNYVSNLDGEDNPCTNIATFAHGVASDAHTDCLDKKLSTTMLDGPLKDVDRTELEMLIEKADDSDGSELPSVYQILDAWKESRESKKEDGILPNSS